MIKESRGSSWTDLVAWIEEIQSIRLRLELKTQGHVSRPVFRGHAQADWKLETTLERFMGTMEVNRYYHYAHAAKYEVSEISGRSWDILTPPEYATRCESMPAFGQFGLPAYDYLVYLRHHGFPSPLLDWSRSPFIAAFFAFRHAAVKHGDVAIYAYIEYAGEGRASTLQRPTIYQQGPYVQTHRRHYAQQCDYTICAQKVDSGWFYVPHEEAVANAGDGQDLLWRIVLPADLGRDVHRRLNDFGLNAFSLFGSEDALMESVAVKEMLLV